MGIIAAPLQGLPIEEVCVDLAPALPNLPRTPFPLIDLRRRAEEHPGFSGNAIFEKDSHFLARHCMAPVALKPDPLFSARQVSLHNGAIWAERQLVPGSFRPKLLDETHAKGALLDHERQLGRLPRLPGTTALIYTPGFPNYFHWMTEALPRLMVLAEYRRRALGPLDRILISPADPNGYVLKSVGIFFPDLLPLVEITHAPRCDLDSALFFLDWRSIARVLTRVKDSTALFLERIAAVSPTPAHAGRALLISRGDADNRRLVNEAALLDTFAPLGLEAVRFTGMPVTDQMRAMAEARLVIGVHGAGLTNAMFCRPGTAMIEITSTQYMRRCRSYADIAAFRSLPYALVVADQIGNDWVVTKNRGNDLELSAEALAELKRLAASLLAPLEHR